MVLTGFTGTGLRTVHTTLGSMRICNSKTNTTKGVKMPKSKISDLRLVKCTTGGYEVERWSDFHSQWRYVAAFDSYSAARKVYPTIPFYQYVPNRSRR